MKKLRLIMTTACERDCEGCCNKGVDTKSLPVASDYGAFDEILMTGGEPLLYPFMIKAAIQYLRTQTEAKLYFYTARTSPIFTVLDVLQYADGMCVTLHEQGDVEPFLKLHAAMAKNENLCRKSLRLNIFKGVKISLYGLTFWNIRKDIVWIKNAPLPEGEVLMKFAEDV